jgi:trimeric autotransporter adhesin
MSSVLGRVDHVADLIVDPIARLLGVGERSTARHRRGAVAGLAVVSLLLSLVTISTAHSVVNRKSTISTVAGSTPGFAGDGGPAVRARLNQPRDTAVTADGTIYVADTFNNRIRKIAPNGTITTIAGRGSSTYNGDHIAATSASLYWPHDVTARNNGVVYIADSAHHRIRKVNSQGVITTIAGTGAPGSTGDGGAATSARIRNPKSVALYGGGLFFSSLENKVRRVDLASGIITTVAGTGVAGYSGDHGPATRATLHSPQRLAIDSIGNIYVADSNNNAVRRIRARTGVITTVAGNGRPGSTGDGGPGTRARLDHPRGLAIEGDSMLYIADSNSHRVRRLNLTTRTIRGLAGTTKGFSGDRGPAGRAQLFQPRGLTLMPGGGLLIADAFNNRLRLIRPGTP